MDNDIESNVLSAGRKLATMAAKVSEANSRAEEFFRQVNSAVEGTRSFAKMMKASKAFELARLTTTEELCRRVELKTPDAMVTSVGIGEQLDEIAELLRERRPPAQQETQPYCFRRKGDFWEVRFDGEEEGSFVDLKGFGIIARLLRSPNPQNPVPAAELLNCPSSGASTSPTVQPALDAEAVRQYKQEIADYEARIEKTRTAGDHTQAEVLQRERDQVVEELNRKTGAFGKPRRLGPKDAGEKARQAVRRNLDRAYDRIVDAGMPRLLAHLRTSICTEGDAYAYRPHSPIDWNFD